MTEPVMLVALFPAPGHRAGVQVPPVAMAAQKTDHLTFIGDWGKVASAEVVK